MLIKNHKDLAKHIEGKRILHLNSFGKDCAVTLEWLYFFAKPEKIISVHFEPFVPHYGDEYYLNYQKKRYPNVEFIFYPNPQALSRVANGIFQSPMFVMDEINNWEYSGFSLEDSIEYVKKKYNCDFSCNGMSKYESVSRASSIHKNGLVKDGMIYPIGMMKKKDIFSLIKKTGLKIHPVYKYLSSGLDRPSYYKMRSSFIVSPEYKNKMYDIYPMLELDEFRYEKLFKGAMK